MTLNDQAASAGETRMPMTIRQKGAVHPYAEKLCGTECQAARAGAATTFPVKCAAGAKPRVRSG